MRMRLRFGGTERAPFALLKLARPARISAGERRKGSVSSASAAGSNPRRPPASSRSARLNPTDRQQGVLGLPAVACRTHAEATQVSAGPSGSGRQRAVTHAWSTSGSNERLSSEGVPLKSTQSRTSPQLPSLQPSRLTANQQSGTCIIKTSSRGVYTRAGAKGRLRGATCRLSGGGLCRASCMGGRKEGSASRGGGQSQGRGS
jgi:hypothetical protein